MFMLLLRKSFVVGAIQAWRGTLNKNMKVKGHYPALQNYQILLEPVLQSGEVRQPKEQRVPLAEKRESKQTDQRRLPLDPT